MYKEGLSHSLALVLTQLEAASTLLKYAADDIREASGRSHGAYKAELSLLVANLSDLTISVDANAAFCGRIVEEIDARPAREEGVEQQAFGA